MNHLHRLQQVYSPGEGRAIYNLVMERRFGLSPTQVLLGKDTELSAEDLAELQNIVERLLRKEPVQYVLGEADFCGHTFHVEPGVLIPRPETAELVQHIGRRHSSPCRILDIGTGSGSIAISLALLGHQVTAMEISPRALHVARENAKRLGASLDFVQEDILHPSDQKTKWDIIVSNPPYICDSEAASMDDNVLLHEPHLALFVPDEDPLLFYRAITSFALAHLSPDGHIYFECNRLYAKEVSVVMADAGFRDTHVLTDQFNNQRFVEGRL